MKILHIGNTAGVGSIIAEYMDRLFGTRSLVVTRHASDPYGVTTYGELWDCGAKVFVLKCLLLARKFDLVHVHYVDKIVPFLKLLYPRKPVVLHYHGDDIRGKWLQRRKYWSKADAILYSTPDLLDKETPENAEYMPNPVNTGLFNPSGYSPERKTAYHISYNADDLARKYAEKYGLKLTIQRREEQVIPHIEFPNTLRKYEYYIDVKRDIYRRVHSSLSKTGLEALACGLKVIRGDGEILRELPEEHSPAFVVKKVFYIYLNLREGKDYGKSRRCNTN